VSTKTLRIGAVFRADDPDAAIVLRVVAAANDLGLLFRMMLAYTGEKDQIPFRKGLSDAARIYACRMGTLHLPDVWKLVNSGDFRRVQARLGRRLPGLDAAVERFRDTVNRSPLQKLVAGVRNNIAGHPNEEAFVRALGRVQSDLMDVPTGYTGGHGDHFNVTDRLYCALLVEDAHAEYSEESLEASTAVLIEEMIAAQLALRDLAAGLVVAMYLDSAP
jgi:hypothetical protein